MESEIKECIDPDGKIKAENFFKKPLKFNDFEKIIREID